MARRRKSQPIREQPLPTVPPSANQFRRIAIAASVIGFLLIWLIIWVLQDLYSSSDPAEPHPRWHLLAAALLVPDETFAAWFDGVISVQGVIDRLWVALVMLIVVVPGAWLGYESLAASSASQRMRPTERWMLSLAVGMSIHATLTLIAGLAGLVSQPLAMPMVAAIEVVCGTVLRLRFPNETVPRFGIFAELKRMRRRYSIAGAVIPLAVFALAMLIVAARCIMPPAEFDVLEYHVGAPKEWFLDGSIKFSPHNIYANMPMAAEMQTLSAMSWSKTLGTADAWWWGGLVGKAVMFVYWALTIGLSGCLVRRIAGRDAACWTVAVAGTATALVEVTSLGLIEAAVACYFAAALLMLAIGRRDFGSKPASVFWIGFFAGSAMACKYPAPLLFVCFPVGVLAAVGTFRLNRSPGGMLKAASFFLLGCMLTAGPWLAKNAVLAGNPVYPLAASILGGRTMTPEKISQWNAAHTPSSRSAADLLGKVSNVAWSWKSQDALIVPLALLGLLTVRRSKSTVIALCLVFYTFGIWWLLTHHLERFLLPAIPIAFMLSGMGIRLMQRHLSRRTAAFVLLIGIACNLCLVAVSPLMGDPRIAVDPSYLRGESITPGETIRIPKHVQWANQELIGTPTKLLLIGDAAIFNYESSVLYATCFDRSLLTEIIDVFPPEQWRDQFVQRGIGHVLVHWGEIERYRSPGNYGFDPSITPGLFDRLVANGVLQPVETGFAPAIAEVFVVVTNE